MRLQELEALAVFTYQMNDHNRSEITDTRGEIKTASAKRLQYLVQQIDARIDDARKLSGCTVTVSTLVQLYKQIQSDTARVFTMPKWQLQIDFTQYERCFPGWDVYPPHAMIPIAVSGDLRDGGRHGVYLPEALVYEDMCAAYNLGVRSEKIRHAPHASKVEIKTHDMAVRTAILTAYYFVEAYLNAVAFDFWSAESNRLSPEDIDALLEFDSKKQRQRWLSLEEKTSRYPRIILGAQHSPLMTSNCKELEYLLHAGKELRDSIVHPSPKIDRRTMRMEKVGHIIGVRLNQATAAADAAIGYIRKLNSALGKHGCDLWWLVDRDHAGTFPDAAFQ